MVVSRLQLGAVYILENAKARRVKVGVTGANINSVLGRLKDADIKWSGKKATCQVCGARRLASKDGLMPQHPGFIPQFVDSRRICLGANELPLEKDVRIAESHLERQKQALHKLSGSEKGSVARQTKTLEKRIELYRDYQQPEGIWQFSTAFYTDCAGQVELLSHEILSEHLDKQAPLGEVFCCSLSEAMAAVESALSQLELLDAVRKETRDDTTSAEYGECIICGGQLTNRESCPECAQKFRNI